jgi:hypothetical protein
MSRALFILILIPVLFLAAQAAADVREARVQATLLGVPEAAETGTPFEGIIRLESFGPHDIGYLELAGSGWRVELDRRPVGLLDRGQFRDIPFKATPRNPEMPLTLSWRCDGKPMEKAFDLSPRAIAQERPGAWMRVDPSSPPRSLADDPPAPERLDLLENHTAAELEDLAKRSADDPDKDVTITVTGNVYYGYPWGSAPIEFVEASFIRVGVLAEYVTGLGTIESAAYGWTDGSGAFSIDLPWSGIGDPDIQVVLYAWNGATMIKRSMSYFGPWDVAGPLYPAYSGTTLDMGTIAPASLSGNQALHVAEMLRRNQEFWDQEVGVSLPLVETQFVWQFVGTAAYYHDAETIAIYSDDAWLAATHSHEYGHYVNHNLPMHWVTGFTYCNQGDYCDYGPDPEDCSHCLECNENWEIAFMEGWAQLCSRLGTHYIESNYDYPSWVWDIGIEEVAACTRDSIPQYQDPEIVEAFFAAALWDLIDTRNEDWSQSPGYRDRLEGYLMEVIEEFQTPCELVGRWPHSPHEVLRCFLLHHPEIREEAWETFRNNLYDYDYEDPGVPTNLVTYPGINIPTPDYTIGVTWDEPEDDISGVNAYAYRWNKDAPAIPPSLANLGDVTGVTAEVTEPGNWYFSIRAFDAAGHAGDWTSTGPVVITDVAPPDLAPQQPTGWDAPLVVRDSGDAGAMSTHYSQALEGGTATTWWNISGLNNGDAPSLATAAKLMLDGTTVLDSTSLPVIGSAGGFLRNNQGPVTVPPGRHSLTMWLDSDEVMSEADEQDNYWCGQFVWRAPTVLPTGEVSSFPAPPDPMAGYEHYQGAGEWYLNCSGHRIGHHPTYQAVWMYVNDYTVNYDLKLFDSYSLIDNGFDNTLAVSSRPKGSVDAVLAFGLNAGLLNTYNLGVINASYDETGWSEENYRTSHVVDTFIDTDYGTYNSFLSHNTLLDIYTFTVEAASNGYVSFWLDPVDDYPMNLSYFNEDFDLGALAEATETMTTSEGEPILMNINAPVGSICAVAVWGDPIATSALKHYYELEYFITKPDPQVHTPALGLGAVVPTSQGTLLPPYYAPPVLTGNSPATYLRFAEMNDSPAAVGDQEVAVYLDGELLDTLTPANAMAAGGQVFYAVPSSYMVPGAYTVPGGRHTLTMVIDPDDVIDETREYNNDAGYQWVWSAEELPYDTPLQRDVPAAAMGGRLELWPEVWKGYNCLGLRTPSLADLGDRFLVVYAGADEDVDLELRLHEPSTGPEDGYTEALAASLPGFGEVNYILLDMYHAEVDTVDVGVSCLDGCAGDCWIELAGSDNTPSLTGTGYHGDLYLGGMVNVHWVNLPDGLYNVILTDYDSRVDLGLSAHNGGTAFASRLDLDEAAQSYRQPGGVDEEVTFRVTGGQQAAILVWRPDPAHDYQEFTEYALLINDISGTEYDDVPVVSHLIGAAPNPFNRGTTIRYELHQAGKVDLAVYDLLGRLVTRLVQGHEDAGPHQVEWRGVDSAGTSVSSGVYLCRLETATVKETQRVLLVK